VAVSPGWERRIYNDTTILTANAAPTGIALGSAVVAENEPIGTTIGLLTSIDASEDTHLYTLVAGPGSDHNGSFSIAGNLLQTNASFDFETKDSYKIRVRSTDQDGLAFEEEFTISVTDIPDWSIDAGLLSVTGTPLDDTITVLNDGGTIKIDANGSVIDTGLAASSMNQVVVFRTGRQRHAASGQLTGCLVSGTLLGGEGDDVLISGLGNDTLDGEAGFDTASYIQAGVGVRVNLSTVLSQNTVGAGRDLLVEVEGLFGSDFNDVLTGNSGDNSLWGGNGNDTLNGGLGADSIRWRGWQ
jgi:Ca2+-binding RTX toxin-like protein